MKPRRKTPLEIKTTEPHMCTVDLRLRLLGQQVFFYQLSTGDLILINQKFSETGYGPEDFIYQAGDRASHLFIVAEGRVKLFQTSANGKNVLLDLLAPGEFFGSLSALGTPEYPDTAQAQTHTCVLKISSDDFRQILDTHPGVTLKILEALSQRLHAANDRFFLISSAPVEKRVAVTLLKLADKFGRKRRLGRLIETPLSRENLAEMTGSTPETVSRVISQFQKEGWIDTGRQWIAIQDISAIQQLAE